MRDCTVWPTTSRLAPRRRRASLSSSQAAVGTGASGGEDKSRIHSGERGDVGELGHRNSGGKPPLTPSSPSSQRAAASSAPSRICCAACGVRPALRDMRCERAPLGVSRRLPCRSPCLGRWPRPWVDSPIRFTGQRRCRPPHMRLAKKRARRPTRCRVETLLHDWQQQHQQTWHSNEVRRRWPRRPR